MAVARSRLRASGTKRFVSQRLRGEQVPVQPLVMDHGAFLTRTRQRRTKGVHGGAKEVQTARRVSGLSSGAE